jgi:hypothetical protein
MLSADARSERERVPRTEPSSRDLTRQRSARSGIQDAEIEGQARSTSTASTSKMRDQKDKDNSMRFTTCSPLRIIVDDGEPMLQLVLGLPSMNLWQTDSRSIQAITSPCPNSNMLPIVAHDRHRPPRHPVRSSDSNGSDAPHGRIRHRRALALQGGRHRPQTGHL